MEVSREDMAGSRNRKLAGHIASTLRKQTVNLKYSRKWSRI